MFWPFVVGLSEYSFSDRHALSYTSTNSGSDSPDERRADRSRGGVSIRVHRSDVKLSNSHASQECLRLSMYALSAFAV